jgi:CheY-like chemotaxis protein
VPVIAITANAMAGDDRRCLAAGMNDYITKPIDRARLLEKVVQWGHRAA